LWRKRILSGAEKLKAVKRTSSDRKSPGATTGASFEMAADHVAPRSRENGGPPLKATLSMQSGNEDDSISACRVSTFKTPSEVANQSFPSDASNARVPPKSVVGSYDVFASDINLQASVVCGSPRDFWTALRLTR